MKNSRSGLWLAAVLLTAPALAQVNYGTLTGTVEDQNGGAVPEAIVRVSNVATAESRQVPTGSTGTYTLPDSFPARTMSKSQRLDFAHLCEPASP